MLLCSSVGAFQTARHGQIAIGATRQRNSVLPKDERTITTSLPAVNPIISGFQAIESPLGSLAVLAGVVIVHEAGHFLAARNFGVKINEFSVGFGPKLFGFKALKSKREGDEGVQFSVRALPLGGYGESILTVAYFLHMELLKLHLIRRVMFQHLNYSCLSRELQPNLGISNGNRAATESSRV